MNADEFVRIVREGSDKLRVDDVVVSTGKEEAHGKGLLLISREELKVAITLETGHTLPDVAGGSYTRRDLWKLTGVIDDVLTFTSDVWPSPPSSRTWSLGDTNHPGGITKYEFDVHPITLVPSGMDVMSSRERSAFYKEIKKQHGIVESQQPPQPGATASEEPAPDDAVRFDAILFEYPSVQRFFGATPKGDFGGYEFTLEQEKPGQDLQVSLSSKKEHHSSGEEEDWRNFHALMNALAFVHGAHAWPYRTQYWRGGRKITDRITAADRLPRTTHAPFDKRLAATARAKKLEWDYLEPLKRAAAFFEAGSTLSKEVADILFLFREADDGTHSEITTIALCVLFENLVQAAFRELKLEEKTRREDPALQDYEQAKSEVLELITQRKGDGYERVRRVLSNAQPFSLREMLQALAHQFGLQWENDLEAIFKTWQHVRNPLFHDTLRADRTENHWKELPLNQSRIAGGINVLLLKLFGYSGLMRPSTFEEKYRKL